MLGPVNLDSLSLKHPLLLVILSLLGMPLLQSYLFLQLPLLIHPLYLLILLQYEFVFDLLHFGLPLLANLLLPSELFLLLGFPLGLLLLHLGLLFDLFADRFGLSSLEFSDAAVYFFLGLFALFGNCFVHFALELSFALFFFFTELCEKTLLFEADFFYYYAAFGEDLVD